ncbi:MULTISPECIES: hypothetical protein [Lysinibacillus]|jgi:hypothetical protein|uniref:Uncharacterized protein n=1 Tax=Lysinibacillus fusiformis TaxID=28031 RepID=A0A2I0V1N0_9BACI|nr:MULTISPECIES: hypothetical protein [Lysinibacillus]KUF32750.1 hypothetical protein AK833_12415 [Lysinibacillus sp. F5]MEE3805634.1 hypothetical protein [Lysinibacillus fusiformis]PKU52223.1 hypothetical protein CRI88_07610 [Lysinibacillus fusiformis]WCH46658.1 hypothetical protein NV349_16405 [Lysinibacillus sp. OF-1]SCZ05571.1 hypothetical protein SAMN02787078_03895 [Lysinibacillus sp. SG9]
MRIKFNVDEDIFVLKNEDLGYDYYFDSYLEVLVSDGDVEELLFSTTMHSTIVIELNELLIRLHQTNEVQKLDPFGNANIISFEKKGHNLIITNYSQLSGNNEWVHTFDLFDFTSAYINELKRYLNSLMAVDSNVIKYKSFVYLKEGLDSLQAIN